MKQRTLGELGEFGLIARMTPACRASAPDGVGGIGDDCAVVPLPDGRVRLVTTDLLVEDIHFLRARIPPGDLGHKALAVNLSDIAAMGGVPLEAYLSLGLPSDLSLSWVDAFYDGFLALARREGVALLGGDTTRTPGPIIVNVVVIGEGREGEIRRRGDAVCGDVVCVTDRLGDSAGGLKILLEAADLVTSKDDDVLTLVDRHHRPRPHLDEGRWIAVQPGVHAMMDVSDGIDSDLRHILEFAGCGARVDLDRLPISPALRRVSRRLGWDAGELACCGGEDYCLLVTVEPGALHAVQAGFEARFHRPLFAIGRLDGPPGRLEYVSAEGRVIALGRGFDHFRS